MSRTSLTIRLFGFCRNKGLKLIERVGAEQGLEGQAIELLGSGRDFAIGVIQLPLFDHVHGLDASDEFGGAVEVFESEHGLSSSLDGAVILLDEVVQVFRLTQFDFHATVGDHTMHGGRIGTAFVNGDFLRHVV